MMAPVPARTIIDETMRALARAARITR